MFSRVAYSDLNSRQKENYNFQKVAARLADYGFNSIRLTDDWQGADFIAVHIDGETFLKVQLKGRHWSSTGNTRARESTLPFSMAMICIFTTTAHWSALWRRTTRSGPTVSLGTKKGLAVGPAHQLGPSPI